MQAVDRHRKMVGKDDAQDKLIKYMYETKKDISFWQTQYFITVNTIDGKLEELTSAFLNGEMENINIAATVDEIQGVEVDIYR